MLHISFPSIGNVVVSNHVVVLVSTDFISNSKRNDSFHRSACDCSRVYWDGLLDNLTDVTWEDIFKLGASVAAAEFCKWVQVRIGE